jgi:hypothetical protein
MGQNAYSHPTAHSYRTQVMVSLDHHRFPRNGTRKPRCTPPARGFLFTRCLRYSEEAANYLTGFPMWYATLAEQDALVIIKGYVGPDHKISDMQSFYRALVEALCAAHEQGWKDRVEAEKLTRH